MVVPEGAQAAQRELDRAQHQRQVQVGATVGQQRAARRTSDPHKAARLELERTQRLQQHGHLLGIGVFGKGGLEAGTNLVAGVAIEQRAQAEQFADQPAARVRDHVERHVRGQAGGGQRGGQLEGVVERAAGEAAVVPREDGAMALGQMLPVTGPALLHAFQRGRVGGELVRFELVVARILVGRGGAGGPQLAKAAGGAGGGAVQEQQHALRCGGRQRDRAGRERLPAGIGPVQQAATVVIDAVVERRFLERGTQLGGDRRLELTGLLAAANAAGPATDKAAERDREVVDAVERGGLGQLADRVAIDRRALTVTAAAALQRTLVGQLEGQHHAGLAVAVAIARARGLRQAVRARVLDRVGEEHRAVGKLHRQHLARTHQVGPAKAVGRARIAARGALDDHGIALPVARPQLERGRFGQGRPR